MNALGRILLAIAVLFPAAILLPELVVDGGVYPHDGALHLPAIERLADAAARGENVLDCWTSEWTCGYPLWRSYQPLGHLATLGIWYASFRSIPLDSLYGLLTYLLLVTFPITCWFGARWLGGDRLQAGCVALVSGLLASSVGYGFELDSYLWRGNGTYTQLWAQWLFPLAVGRIWISMRSGHQLAITGVLGGLVFVAHLLYGYALFVTAALLLLTRPFAEARATRIRRLGIVGLAMGSVAAFVVVPLLRSLDWVNISKWEEPWKWDSFGHAQVLGDLVRGDLFDAGRLPIVTLLLAGGVVLAIRGWREERNRFVLAAFATWLLLFFGRGTWGLLLDFLAIPRGFHLHRLIGPVHFFGALLAAGALAALLRFGYEQLGRRTKSATALATTCGAALVLLTPALLERAAYAQRNGEWISGDQTRAERAQESALAELRSAVLPYRTNAEGRVFPGLAGSWGATTGVGWIDLSLYLSRWRVPVAARLLHSMGHAGDLAVRFDERRESHYRLFGIAAVVAPKGRTMPAFLDEQRRIGDWRLYEAPGGGYFDVVAAPLAFVGNNTAARDLCEKWLASPLVDARQHLRLAQRESGDLPARRIDRYGEMPSREEFPGEVRGRVVEAARDGETYRALVAMQSPGFLLFKMGFHPDWTATSGDRELECVPLSPFFVGVPLPAGEHEVVLEYRPGPQKQILLLLGLLGVVSSWLLERRFR